MATDRDRFARVLDKRFSGTAYLLATGSFEAVGSAVTYALKREQEAEPELKALFLGFIRILVRERRSPRLPEISEDPEARSLRERAMRSQSGMRLTAAFDDVMRNGDVDLAGAFAARSYNWIRGCLEGMKDWPDARVPFKNCGDDFRRRLADTVRWKYLNVGEPAETSAAQSDQGKILGSSIPVNL